jgi:hypothetical protein
MFGIKNDWNQYIMIHDNFPPLCRSSMAQSKASGFVLGQLTRMDIVKRAGALMDERIRGGA